MKTPEQISTRIIENIEHMLKFPKMWFHEPECMENQLMYLTNLLLFIQGRPDYLYRYQYSDYLVEKGYQANTFVYSLKENGPIDADAVLLSFSEFFKEFFDKFKASLAE